MLNGIAMWIAFCFLTSWISAQTKRRVVGYGLITDISTHVVLQLMFGADSDGRIAMLFAGLLINATMHGYRKMYGWERLTAKGWVRYAGAFTPPAPPPPPPTTKRKATRKRAKA